MIQNYLFNSYGINPDDYKNDNMLWGWLAAYPTFIFTGALVAVICCAIKFRIKRMPMSDLQVGIVIALPIGVLFASFFGKMGIGTEIDWKFWEYFYIWNPGMNLFGGLLGGLAASLFWFSRCAQKRCISLWTYADCIVPNILIAQSIGRWGNLFNHEILGKPVDVSKVDWLPAGIWHRLFYLYDPSTGEKTTDVILREPLFLYESFATFLLFLLLTFIVPNLGRWFSKKPWKKSPSDFPCIFNREVKWAKYNNVYSGNVQMPIKYKKNKKNPELVSLSLWQVWNKAYYLQDPDHISIDVYQKQIEDYKHSWERYIEARNKIQKKYRLDLSSSKQQFRLNKKKLNEKIKIIKIEYKANIKIMDKPAKNKFIFWWKTDCTSLYKANNTENYFVIHSGTLSACYLFFYSLIRFILELRRNPYEYSIKSNLPLDITMYICLLISGIILFVLAQFIAPKKWREKGWLYEKSY